MTDKNINTQIPVIFQKLEEFEKEDSRFLKVKIWLMHTGQNLNGSAFSKEAVDKAIPTLANTPILSFIEDNTEGEKDFSDHRMALKRTEDGEYSIKYLGDAVGVIPETNNAHWEMRVTDSGEEKEYLVVDALMWTKWDDPTDIMTAKGTTAQSMELADDYTGIFDDNNVFHFDTFKFWGACLLGEGVQPAMQNSTAELQFTENAKEAQKTIENKLEEFYTLFSQQGGTEMAEELDTQEELETTETEVEAEVENTEVDTTIEFTSTEETKVEKTEEIQMAQTEETEEVDQEETPEPTNAEEPVQEFALTASQLQDQIRSELGKENYQDSWGDQCRRYWYVDHTDAIAIFEDCQNGYQLHAAPYALSGDAVELKLDEAYKVKVEFVPFEGEAVAFTANVERFASEKSTLESQLEDLKSYKRTREEEDMKGQFSDKLSDEEVIEVFTAMKESSMEDIEVKLFALLGKKNFSTTKTTTQTVNKVAFSLPKDDDKVENPYGDIFNK